ncbi:MAG: DUF4398 domain-containing protein [Polyangiaceae bacterium]
MVLPFRTIDGARVIIVVARKRSGMIRRLASAAKALRVALVVSAGLSMTGCGGLYYAVEAGAASSKLEQARLQDAEHKAPYHYFLAQEYLKKASEEAASADYSDAIDLAEAAADEATKAINISRTVMKESEK